MKTRIWAISLLIGTIIALLTYFFTKKTVYYYLGKEVPENLWKISNSRQEKKLKDIENFRQDTTHWGGDKMFLQMEADSVESVKEEITTETSKYYKKYEYNLVLTLLSFIGGLALGLVIQTVKKNTA